MSHGLVKLFSILSLSLFYALPASSNSPSPYPRGCTPATVTFQDNYVILGTRAKQNHAYRDYVFKNTSYAPVRIEQISKGNSPGPKLTSTLDPNLMSALLLNQEKFAMACADDNYGYVSNIACHEVIKVCELAVSPVMASAQGQYWAVENQTTQHSLFEQLREHGIFP